MAPLIPYLGTEGLGGMWGLCPALDAPARVATTRRTLAHGVIGARAAERAPEEFFEVVHEGMRQLGYRTAMLAHMHLAVRLGRPGRSLRRLDRRSGSACHAARPWLTGA